MYYMREPDFAKLREEMVYYQILKRGLTDKKILDAFRNIPRHLFVPEEKRHLAYEDYPLPIGEGQTISQPYIVALMTQLLDIRGREKVLEIGTGSGYQAAILFYLGARVYGTERIATLVKKAEKVLTLLDLEIAIKVADGTLGWQEESPYDRIIVTAAAPSISPCWLEQLVVGGKLVVPLGNVLHQDLTVVEKISQDKTKQEIACGCMFVPLIGKYGFRDT